MIGNVPGEYSRTAHTILQNIFIFNKSRGDHAAGFSAIHTRDNKRLITEKRPISSTKFVERSAKFKALAKDMPNIFVGHTRFSTSGSPRRNRNNHPFNSGDYSMVHNGGINDWQRVASLNNIDMRSETDSEIILRLVERRKKFHDGIGLTMQAVGFSSRIAVAMLRHRDDPRLFLFRNSYNPIHIMPYPRMHSIFFSSEKNHLKMALRSVYGDSVDEVMHEHDVSIEEVPTWTSLEFRVTDDGRPVLDNELKVDRPITAGFHGNKSSSTKQVIEIDNSDVFDVEKRQQGSSSLPVVQGQNGQTKIRQNVNEMSTGDMLRAVSDDTRDRSVALSRSIRESTKVLESIRKNPFMSFSEIEHFKKWMEYV